MTLQVLFPCLVTIALVPSARARQKACHWSKRLERRPDPRSAEKDSSLCVALSLLSSQPMVHWDIAHKLFPIWLEEFTPSRRIDSSHKLASLLAFHCIPKA